jgi:hypothetical protein
VAGGTPNRGWSVAFADCAHPARYFVGREKKRRIACHCPEVGVFVLEEVAQFIVGASTMQKWRFKLDFEADEVIHCPPRDQAAAVVRQRMDSE